MSKTNQYELNKLQNNLKCIFGFEFQLEYGLDYGSIIDLCLEWYKKRKEYEKIKLSCIETEYYRKYLFTPVYCVGCPIFYTNYFEGSKQECLDFIENNKKETEKLNNECNKIKELIKKSFEGK